MRLYLLIGLLVCMTNTNLFAQLTGYKIAMVQTGAMVQKTRIMWFAEELAYTPGNVPAGVTFTYPAGYFGITPTVLVSVRKDGLTADTLATPIVVANSTVSTRVLVTVLSNPIIAITEADATYFVTIYAFEDEPLNL